MPNLRLRPRLPHFKSRRRRSGLSRVLRGLLALGLMWALSAPGSLYAETLQTLQSNAVVLRFPPALRPAAEEILSFYEATKTRLEGLFGWPLDFRPTVILIRERARFQALAGSDLFVAFALPRNQLIVIDHSQMGARPFTLEATLRHELCHLLLHRHLDQVHLPRWLDEGVAQWASDGLAEIVMGQRRSALQRALLHDSLIPIKALAAAFPLKRDALALAYEQSKCLVEYIVARFGTEGLLQIMENLRRGVAAEQALLEVTSLSLDELEGQWHTHLKRRITWLTYLLGHFYEALFFVAALVVIAAFLRTLARKRAYLQEVEEDDPPGASDDPGPWRRL